MLLVCTAPVDHRRISQKTQAAAGDIKPARLCICTDVTSLYSASHHSTLVLAVGGRVFYLVSVQIQEKMNVNMIDETTF